MPDSLSRADRTPVYNIKAVSRLVGLQPVTLRAWERRYGLPHPLRGDQGYRLYSEHDLRTLRWLKMQLDSGLNIGRAVEYLHELQQHGLDPALQDEPAPEGAPASGPEASSAHSPSPNALSSDLLARLLEFDEHGAAEVMRRAFAIYAVDQVLMEIVTPTLERMGEMWHQGSLPIATEHYASQFCMQHMMSLLSAAAPAYREGLIVAACAPGETHQIGILMLLVMLRWRGWNVKYLGPDLKLDGLATALIPLHPSLLMFSANRSETAANLSDLPDVLERFPHPKPLVILGGQAFQQMRLAPEIPAVYINASPTETIKTIENLMQAQPTRNPLLKENAHV